MSFDDCRNAVFETLNSKLKAPISKTIEQTIYNSSNGDLEVYRLLAYEKLGQILTVTDSSIRKEIFNDIKRGQNGFDSCVYKRFKADDDETTENTIKIVDVEDSEYKCKRCHSLKCVLKGIQERSADEGETVYVVCTKCSYSYKL